MDLNRTPWIKDGYDGSEISCEDDWTEGGRERRLKFYFHEDGILYDSGVFDSLPDWQGNWLFTNMSSGYRETLVTRSQITVLHVGTSLFHCEHVEFNYFPNEWCTEVCLTGKFVSQDFYAGMFLEDAGTYDPCALSVYNPCANITDKGTTECQAIDGLISCITPSLKGPLLDSRRCSD